jgi:cyclic 2,3-diphosphoglycerate synthetase
VSDLVVLMNGTPEDADRLRAFAEVPVVRTTMRLQPLEPIEGRVAVFTTAAVGVDHLGFDVVARSTNLSNRPLLREDLAGIDADTYLVEIKAAGIDVVAEHGVAHGRRVVFVRNEVVGLDGDDVDGALLALAEQAVPA